MSNVTATPGQDPELVNDLDQRLSEIDVLTKALGLARQPASIGILTFGDAELVVLVAIISAKISQARHMANILYEKGSRGQLGVEDSHAG